MVDTVKIRLDSSQFTLSDKVSFGEMTQSAGMSRSVRNASASEKRAGLYLPKITLIKRPSTKGMVHELTVEFSAPKLVYGNNFDELEDSDFPDVVLKLQKALHYMGVETEYLVLINAKVVTWHPSKNIVLDEYFGCQVIIGALQKVDINRIYSIRSVSYQEGEIVHFHTNSKDIAFYDKLADLRSAKISDKRAFENDNKIQMELYERLSSASELSVLRFEIRLNGIRSIRRNFPDIPANRITFSTLFHKELSRNILRQHWLKLIHGIDYIALDVKAPYEILQNYLIQHDDTTPQAALAVVAGLCIANQKGMSALRQTLEARFGRHYWGRIKNELKLPDANRYLCLVKATDILDEFKAIKAMHYLNKVCK